MKRFAPALFVLLWSTGFIVARYATHDANPLTFLCIRTAIAAVVLFVCAKATHEASMNNRQRRVMFAVGTGMHAMYLGGVFVAVHHGLPSGISALIAALHPVLTVAVSRLALNERISRIQLLGVVLGVSGVLGVVIAHGGAGDGVSRFALVAMSIAVVGMSAGTLVQRRYAQGVPLLQGTAWQYVTASVLLGGGAVTWEGWHVQFTARTIFSLAWAVGVLSIAAILIMLWLLHRQAASQVSSLFFLTPALSAVEGAILFHETLGAWAVVGLTVALCGVWLSTSQRFTLQT